MLSTCVSQLEAMQAGSCCIPNVRVDLSLTGREVELSQLVLSRVEPRVATLEVEPLGLDGLMLSTVGHNAQARLGVAQAWF